MVCSQLSDSFLSVVLFTFLHLLVNFHGLFSCLLLLLDSGLQEIVLPLLDFLLLLNLSLGHFELQLTGLFGGLILKFHESDSVFVLLLLVGSSGLLSILRLLDESLLSLGGVLSLLLELLGLQVPGDVLLSLSNMLQLSDSLQLSNGLGVGVDSESVLVLVDWIVTVPFGIDSHPLLDWEVLAVPPSDSVVDFQLVLEWSQTLVSLVHNQLFLEDDVLINLVVELPHDGVLTDHQLVFAGDKVVGQSESSVFLKSERSGSVVIDEP